MNHHKDTFELFPREAVVRFLNLYGNGGRSIPDWQELIDCGFPETTVDALFALYPIPGVVGVSTVRVLREIAQAVGAALPGGISEPGFREQAYARAIRQVLNGPVLDREQG
jgi:hypothetical protein